MKDAISLGVGEPDFDTPWHIREEGIYSLEKGRTFYTSNAGLKELKEEICNYLKRRMEVSYLPDSEVMVTVGGSEAIDIALRAMLNPGDEVLVQSFTFCASSHPVTYLGATPVFVDSEPDSWNIDPDLLEKAINDRVAVTGHKPKAIIPVALYGMPYRIDRITEIADRHGIPVIEDAAEGLGSTFDGRILGTFGRYGVLSFNGNKMITTSGGGALVCPTPRPRTASSSTQRRHASPTPTTSTSTSATTTACRTSAPESGADR